MDFDKFEQFQLQMDLVFSQAKENGGGEFKLSPTGNYSLKELLEYISRYKDIHKTDYTIWTCLDNVNQWIKVLVK